MRPRENLAEPGNVRWATRLVQANNRDHNNQHTIKRVAK